MASKAEAFALEASVLTQVQNLLIYDVLGIIALEVSVLAQIQNDRKLLHRMPYNGLKVYETRNLLYIKKWA